MQVMRRIYVILLLLLLLACNNGGGSSESSRFDSFLEREFVSIAKSDTTALNALLRYPEVYGIDKTSIISYGNFSPEAALADSRATRATYNELRSFNPMLLTPAQRLEYHALSGLLSRQIDEEFLLYEDVSWVAIDTPIMLAEYNFNDSQDIEIYLRLLSDLPRAFDEIAIFLQAQSAAGLFMPNYAVDELLANMDYFIADPSILVDAFSQQVDELAGLSSAQRTQYKMANQQAINAYVLPAYNKLKAKITSLKGTGHNELGTFYLPNGKRYYEQQVRLLTGLDASVDALYQEINATLAAANAELDALQLSQADLDNADYGEEDYGKILNYLKQRMQSDFPKVDGLHHTVKQVPTALEGMAPAFYMTPTIDDISENIIYIDISQQDFVYNRLAMLAHEGYAGHLYQRNYLADNVSPLRSALDMMSYTIGYTEGWAVYVEQYSYNWVTYINEAPKVAKYWQLYTLLNAVLYAKMDIGVNYYGWTLAQLEAEMAVSDLSDTYEFITQNPGYYVKYFSPYRKIETLRQKAQAAMGGRFDIKEFHKVILDLGPCSFDMIEQAVDGYIYR